MADTIPNVRVTEHCGQGKPLTPEQELAYPWVLKANLSPPEFMQLAFIVHDGGSETVTIRGVSKAALEEAAKKIGLPDHPRLRRMTIEEVK